MKHTTLLSHAIIVGLALLFTGCSESLDDIFAEEDENAIAPVEIQDAGIEKLDVPYYLISGYLYTFKGDDPNHYVQAAVIEHKEILPTSYLEWGTQYEFEWPEIDFEKYSLVLGYIYYVPNQEVGAHRIVRNKDIPELYINLINLTPEYEFDDLNIHTFAELYPKLGYEGEIEVKMYETNGY